MRKNKIMNSLEKGLSCFGRASKYKLAFGSLGHEWTNHCIKRQIPPRDVNEHLSTPKQYKHYIRDQLR